MANILLVDDDEALRRVLGRALRRVGHEVLEACSGIEAMRTLASTVPDLVLTDINMPDMDGIEIVIELRESGRAIPVIAMSGGGISPRETLLQSADAFGASATLEKPFGLHELVAAIDKVLDASASAPRPLDL